MKSRAKYFFCALIFYLNACNESLPVREEVSNLFAATIWSHYETKEFSPKAGEIRLYLSMFNRTGETLDDAVRLTGNFQIEWIPTGNNTPVALLTRNMKITPEDIFYAKNYNKQTKRLILDPNDSIVLSVVWNLKTDDSTYLMNYFPFAEETSCFVAVIGQPNIVERRRISYPQSFTVKGNAKIFDRLAVTYASPVKIKTMHHGSSRRSGTHGMHKFYSF